MNDLAQESPHMHLDMWDPLSTHAAIPSTVAPCHSHLRTTPSDLEHHPHGVHFTTCCPCARMPRECIPAARVPG
eukprot:7609101-Lingulodinium_polyedra.AAC.2